MRDLESFLEKETNKKLKEDIQALKEKISTEGIQSNNNLEYLYKLVDIEKDLCAEIHVFSKYHML